MMKFRGQALLLLLLLSISCIRKQSDRSVAIAVTPYKTDSIVNEIAKENLLTGRTIGMGVHSEQWDRFEMLNKNASDKELIELIEHESAVVKCYAFDALCERNKTDALPILLRHLSDTTKFKTQSGCLVDEEFVAHYFFDKYYSENRNYAQSVNIDSLLLYKAHWRLRMESSLYKRIVPKPQYYARLKQLFINEGETEAIVALAKYRRRGDRKMIRDLLNASDSFIQEDGLNAVLSFPDPSFFPILEKMAREELKTIKEGDVPRELVYKAIVQYKSMHSRQLLDDVLRETKGRLLIEYSDIFFHIVRENPDPIYDGLRYKHTYL